MGVDLTAAVDKNPNSEKLTMVNSSFSAGIAAAITNKGELKMEEDNNVSIEDQIKALKNELADGTPVTPKKPELTTIDYKSPESGRMTFYYKNISNFGVIFSGKTIPGWEDGGSGIPMWPPGEVIDFQDFIDSDELILKFRELKKLENPMQGKPYIKRLTQKEYFRELQIRRDINAKRNELLQSANSDGKMKTEDVSNVVRDRTNELQTYLAKNPEERKKDGYTQYNFIDWLRSYTFNEAEYRWLQLNITDSEIMRSLLDRKAEIDTLSN